MKDSLLNNHYFHKVLYFIAFVSLLDGIYSMYEGKLDPLVAIITVGIGGLVGYFTKNVLNILIAAIIACVGIELYFQIKY